ncbi:MAG: MgtC/SapB family protein [Kiritimatiellae bacterium]|nr:MgtC/SapB family protein [Kiritimatiellia bacterium]
MYLSSETAELITRIIVAALLGSIIGLERELHGRAAGLRTHMLVTTGTALFVILSQYIANISGYAISGDPGRIAAQVVTGIGFLGAGAIIKEGLSVRGLTTAACLWVSASIGMACGMSAYTLAATTTLVVLFGLILLPRIERCLPRDSYRLLTITTTGHADTTDLVNKVGNRNIKVVNFDIQRDFDTNTATIALNLRIHHKNVTDKLSVEILKSVEETGIPLKSISWQHK